MIKQTLITVCLCGLTWAGTAQAGFLGTNLELQFLQNLLNITPTPDSVTVLVGPGVELPDGPGGISVDIGDTTVLVTVPVSLEGPVGLKIVDPTNLDQIASVTDLNAGDSKEVPLDPPGPKLLVAAVPEPGAFALVALGLTILGMTVHQRRRARA
jgi:hypothetical protein